MTLIAHVAIVDNWEAARNLGEYEVSTRGVSLDDAGFIHAVALDGVRGVLEEFYSDIRFALLLVIIDTDALTAAGVDVTEETPGFPHIHGPIPTDGAAVVAELPIKRADGDFVIPDLSRFSGGAAPSTNA